MTSFLSRVLSGAQVMTAFLLKAKGDTISEHVLEQKTLLTELLRNPAMKDLGWVWATHPLTKIGGGVALCIGDWVFTSTTVVPQPVMSRTVSILQKLGWHNEKGDMPKSILFRKQDRTLRLHWQASGGVISYAELVAAPEFVN